MSAFGGKADAPHGVFYEYTPYLNETARLIVGVAGMVKQNEAAIELWRQIFATLANAEDATLVDADYNPTEDEARFREGFAQAGWSEEETQFRLDVLRKQEAGAPVTSPGVSPHVEFLFGLLCDDIEAAMERLHIESHGRVARGIEPRAGPLAANTNVVMTDEGIITVGSFLFRFCGLIARAFTRTLHRAPTFWESANYSHDLARAYVRDDPKLVAYWLRIFLSFSTTGTHVMVPFQPAKRHELVVFEQVARAMEIFAIAHEYGHHHLDHGRRIEDDPKLDEFSADQFALKISYEVERKPILMPNPYLSSGAGGVILLLALETLNGIREVITRIPIAPSVTHPDVDARLLQFDSVSVLKPQEFVALRAFRIASTRIMKTVQSVLLELTNAMPPDAHKLLRALSEA